MTIRNRPSVTAVIGRVMILRIGLMKVFTRLKITATSRNCHHSAPVQSISVTCTATHRARGVDQDLNDSCHRRVG